MKRIILLIAFISLSFILKCQSLKFSADTTKYYYCDLMSLRKPLSAKTNVAIDFGGEQKFINDVAYSNLLNKENKPSSTKSAIEVLNFMGSKGWRCMLHYNASVEGFEVEHFILEKIR